MSPQTIEVHFKETMEIAVRLKELSSELHNVAEKKMLQIICSIKAGWNSECADILVGKEVRIASELVEEADQLNALAVEVESQAKKMYQSEMTNRQLAITRVY